MIMPAIPLAQDDASYAERMQCDATQWLRRAIDGGYTAKVLEHATFAPLHGFAPFEELVSEHEQ
jgi:hypothetical protein